MSFQHLPPELVRSIVDFLPNPRDRIAMASTCRLFRNVITTPAHPLRPNALDEALNTLVSNDVMNVIEGKPHKLHDAAIAIIKQEMFPCRPVEIVLLGPDESKKQQLLLPTLATRTIGVDFYHAMLKSYKHNLDIENRTWDTAGQEHPSTPLINICRRANIVILVFNPTNTQSIETMIRLYQETNTTYQPNTIVMLSGVVSDATELNNAEANNLIARFTQQHTNILTCPHHDADVPAGRVRPLNFSACEFIANQILESRIHLIADRIINEVLHQPVINSAPQHHSTCSIL